MEKEIQKVKCSLKKHQEIEAIIYCQECSIYMCNKCKAIHSDLFENHHLYSLEKNINDIFTGFCKEENHFVELEYFCKTHNQLCCAKCISKFKNKGSGKHGDCEICIIEDIKEEKKEKLNENVKNLEDLSKNIQQSIDELKKLFEKFNLDREEVKLNIQKVFSKLRNKINEREDELLSHVDKKFGKLFFKEELIKESEILPTKIKNSLEKGKNINNEWNNNNLNSLINDCINIEHNIKDIKTINEKIKKYNSINIKIDFYPKDDEINRFIETIKKFGKISHKKFKYAFRECPLNIDENKRYKVFGENEDILAKVGNKCWTGILCQNELKKNDIHTWKIKILKTLEHNILIGVAPSDFDINSSSYQNCGWYFCCCCCQLFSGPPHNHKNKGTNLSSGNIINIKMIMDTKRGILKCILDNSGEYELYNDIPLDKPLFPAVFLRNKNDSVKIICVNYRNHNIYSKEVPKKPIVRFIPKTKKAAKPRMLVKK